MVTKADKEIMFLEPVCTHNIWGGTRIREDFGYNVEGNDIGECWGISAHPNGDGTIKNGVFSGMKLSELWNTHPEIFGNLPYDRFPLLVKIIDARDDLSIQVHPDDEYAKTHENGSYGKTECWYVLDCAENSTLVIGHNAKTREELESMINEGKWKDFIREVPVKKGDFIQINPGTVHAIKGGILILETQQNSDITYRVYDYDRLSNGKPRQLHVKQSIDVITVPAASLNESIISTDDSDEVMKLLHKCVYYEVYKISLTDNKTFEFDMDAPFFNFSVTEGEGKVNGLEVKKGQHFIIPNCFGKVNLEGNMEIIASTVRK